MPISKATPIETHIGNGTTTRFSYQFTVFDEPSLLVYLDDVLQTQNQSYTLTLGLDKNGGDVDFKVAPANGQEVRLVRESELTRHTNYIDNGDLLAKTLNEDFDRLWLIQQENKAANLSVLGRSTPTGPWEAKHVKIEQVADGTLPTDAATVGQLNSIGGGVASNAQQALNAAQAAQQSAAAALGSAQAASASQSAAGASATTAGAQAQLADTSAKAAAKSAQDAATAQSLAEAAQTLAEGNELNSQAAQTAAEAAQTKAEAAQKAAEAAAANANQGIDLTKYPTKTEVAADLAKKADLSAIPSLTGYATKADVTQAVANKADVSAIPDVSNFQNRTQVAQAVSQAITQFAQNSATFKQPLFVLDNALTDTKGLEVGVSDLGVVLKNRADVGKDGLLLGTNGKITFHGDELAFAKDIPAAGSGGGGGAATSVADGVTIRNATLMSPTFRFTAGQPIKLENSQGGLQITRNASAAYVGLANIAAAQLHGSQYSNELRLTDAGGVQFVDANGHTTDLLADNSSSAGGGGLTPDSFGDYQVDLQVGRKFQLSHNGLGVSLSAPNVTGGQNLARMQSVYSNAYIGLKGKDANSKLVFSPDGGQNSEVTIWPQQTAAAAPGLDFAGSTPNGEAVALHGSFTDTATFVLDMLLGASKARKWQIQISLMGAITIETWDSSGTSRGKKTVTTA